MIDFESLWARVMKACQPKHPHSVHGPAHWRRVERNALVLATRTQACVEVVRLFALFHDCQRINEGWDPQHGKRGADFAATLRGEAFELPDDQFELLTHACIWHTDEHRSEDPTIGTCWDADRLDLGRVGMIPDANFMSTEFGAEIANYGTLQPWAHLADPWLQPD